MSESKMMPSAYSGYNRSQAQPSMLLLAFMRVKAKGKNMETEKQEVMQVFQKDIS